VDFLASGSEGTLNVRWRALNEGLPLNKQDSLACSGIEIQHLKTANEEGTRPSPKNTVSNAS
jgi:hypothetical protein